MINNDPLIYRSIIIKSAKAKVYIRSLRCRYKLLANSLKPTTIINLIYMKDNFENFGLSILFGVILPLFCFVLDLISDNDITNKSVLVFLTIYSFTLIMTTKSKLYAFMYPIAGLLFSLKYGAIKTVEPFNLISSITLAYIGIISTYIIERYQIHFIDNEEFLLFTSKKK